MAEIYHTKYTKHTKNQTLKNLLYLFLAFPLGLIYFISLIVGFSIGGGMIIIWVGIPLLLLTLICSWGLAAFEHDMAIGLLDVEIPGISVKQLWKGKLHTTILALITELQTWKNVLFLLLKLPMGILGFVSTITLLTLSVGFFLEPLAYLLNTYIQSMRLTHNVCAHIWLPFFVDVNGHFNPLMFARSFIGTAVGLLLWFVSLYILNGLATVYKEFARVMLSSSPQNRPQPKQETAYQFADHYQQQAPTLQVEQVPPGYRD